MSEKRHGDRYEIHLTMSGSQAWLVEGGQSKPLCVRPLASVGSALRAVRKHAGKDVPWLYDERGGWSPLGGTSTNSDQKPKGGER